jgi:hypothetical protein
MSSQPKQKRPQTENSEISKRQKFDHDKRIYLFILFFFLKKKNNMLYMLLNFYYTVSA